MAACPYAEDGAEHCSGVVVDNAYSEVCSLPASINLIYAVCRSRLLQLEAWSDYRLIFTPPYSSSWSVSYIRSQYDSDLNARVNVTCLAGGYYTFKLPYSIYCPGNGTWLMGRPLSMKFSMGRNHIQCLMQNLSIILAVVAQSRMCILWRTVDSTDSGRLSEHEQYLRVTSGPARIWLITGQPLRSSSGLNNSLMWR